MPVQKHYSYDELSRRIDRGFTVAMVFFGMAALANSVAFVLFMIAEFASPS